MSKIIVGWTLKQALAFVLLWLVVCGPWLYLLCLASKEQP